MTDEPKLGATGEFPDGKLNEEDEGQLRLAITARDGNVIIAFGKPVAWLAMPADEAAKFADAIYKRVREVKGTH